MASERNGSTPLGRGGQAGELGPATSAALTAADPQISTGVPGPGLHLPSGPISTFQQAELSAFERAGREAGPTLGTSLDSGQPSLTPSTGPMTATPSCPSTSSQSTELMFMHSNPSSALSGYSLAAGLQEAMQQMRLQSAAGPGGTQQHPQQPGVAAAAAAASAGPSGQLQLAPSESQGSGDIAQLLGQAQQQQAQQEQQGPATEDGPATLFFAKVPRTATREQIQDVFSRFGEVVSLNLFTPYENSPTSKGCGLVVLRSYSDAASAIAGLDSYKWEGMHSAMVVKLMPPQRQRQEHVVGAAEGGGYRSPAQASSSRAVLSPVPRLGSFSPGGAQLRPLTGVDMPPPGCAHNAYKLFVGNIPRAYSEPDLLPIFESIGTVRELVVLRDRETQESKGSAFVWYATGEDADKAQMSFNMQLVLQNRAGASSRPLVVRRAAPSKQGQQGSNLGGGTVGVTYPAQMQQAYAVAGHQGAVLGHRSQSSYGQMGRPPQHGGSAYGQATSISAQGPSQVYYDPQGHMTVVPQGSYLQQQPQQQQVQMSAQIQMSPQVQQVQQQTPQQHQAAQQQQQQQQQLWQQQQQQQMPAVVHCQAPPAQYGAPVLLSVSEGPAAGYTQVLQVQQGSWQPQSQLQQQQQQPAYMATGYDMSQVPGATPASGPMPYSGMEYAAQQQQQQQGMAAAVMVSSVPQAVPAAQQMSASGMVQQAGPMLAGSSMSPVRSVVYSGTAGSSGSSNVGPVASYQQLGNQHHSLVIPLSTEQLSMINSQLQNVMAMSGTSITVEHNFACGSLALNVVAASRQQLNVAWQIVQGLLGQQSGAAAQMAEALL